MDRLDPYFLAYNKIDQDTEYETLYMEPEELINHRRIDIIAKYYYIKSLETGENIEFAKEIYSNHIEAFSDGTFKEHGNEEKDSLEKYFQTFHKLIDSFKERGFDEDISLIPIGKDNEILDGSHRAACALYFKKKVKVIKFPNLSVDYGFEFFRKRLLDEFYLDFLAKEYIRLDKEIYAFIVWPKVGIDKNLRYIESSLYKDDFTIVYKKELELDKKGLWHFIFHSYRNQHWMGYKGDDSIEVKRDLCYINEGPLNIYILKVKDQKNLIKKKQDLREYFGVRHSSIHTTDTYEESIDILNLILVENYNKALQENFLKYKKTEYTYKAYIKRKIRYLYRRSIDILKNTLGLPV